MHLIIDFVNTEGILAEFIISIPDDVISCYHHRKDRHYRRKLYGVKIHKQIMIISVCELFSLPPLEGLNLF